MNMTQEELAEALELQGKWLFGEEGGERADLTGADLTDAVLRDADLTGAVLTDADLTGAVLRGADLTGAVLTDADLTGAVLRGADLRRADLTDADLTDAVLRDADLTGADLRRADLTDADLTGADLTDAVYWNVVGNRHHIKSMQLERYSIAYTHDRLQIGCEQHAITDWWEFDDARIDAMDSGALEWWRKWKPILQQIIEASPAEPTGAQEQETERD